MTHPEFVAARARILLSVEWQSIASLAVAILATIVNIPLFVHRQDLPPAIRLTGLLAPLVIGVGAPLVFRRRAFAKARKAGLLCPKCQQNLLWSEFVGDKCPNCAAVLFSTASPEASAAALPSKMEFHDRLIAFDRADPLYVAYAIPLGVMASMLLVDSVRRRLGIPEPAWMGWSGLILLLLAVFVAPLFYRLRCEVLTERLGLRCPECYQTVVGTEFQEWVTRYTLRTRKCPLCQSPVIR